MKMIGCVDIDPGAWIPIVCPTLATYFFVAKVGYNSEPGQDHEMPIVLSVANVSATPSSSGVKGRSQPSARSPVRSASVKCW